MACENKVCRDAKSIAVSSGLVSFSRHQAKAVEGASLTSWIQLSEADLHRCKEEGMIGEEAFEKCMVKTSRVIKSPIDLINELERPFLLKIPIPLSPFRKTTPLVFSWACCQNI